MERRKFLKRSLQIGTLLALPLNSSASNLNSHLKFGLSADIHFDIMPDSKDRIKEYLTKMKKEQADFLIDLGDFCHPLSKNSSIIEYWRSFNIDTYFTIGNHDVDYGSKSDFMNFVGMKNRYYSFDYKNFHFVILDPNNLYVDHKYIPYSHANFYKPTNQRGYVDPEQIEWLKNDLNNTNKHCLIFSHQSFQHPYACQNQNLIRQIFENCNKEAGFNKVIASFSGHHHTDYIEKINGVYYLQINSMSYQWLGEKYKTEERYSKELHTQFPHLNKVIPYKDPLYALVEIKNNKLIINGIKSQFIPPLPKDLGLNDNFFDHVPLVPKISNRKIFY